MPERAAPFAPAAQVWAHTTLLSIITCCRSALAENVRCMAAQTPLAHQRWKRL